MPRYRKTLLIRKISRINSCFFQDSNIGIPDVDGKTPLHWAASSKDPEAVECVKRILVSTLINPLHFDKKELLDPCSNDFHNV